MDYLFIIVYIATEMLTYALGYRVVLGKRFCKDKFRWLLLFLTITFIHIWILVIWGKDMSQVLSVVTMIVIPFFLLEEYRWKNIWLYPVIVIGTSTLAMAASFFVAFYKEVPAYQVTENSLVTIVVQCVPIVFLGCHYLIRKIKKIEDQQLEISVKQSVIMYLQIGAIFLLLAPLQSLSRQKVSTSVNIIGISASVLCLLLLLISLWQINSYNNEQKQKELNALIEMQMELQKEYYSKLIRQDELIRSFRHNLRAHLQVLHAYSREGDISKIKEYLEEIMGETAIDDAKVYTGNYEVDAILRPFINTGKQDGIDITVEGCIPNKSIIAVYDLCSLVYNLLKNAVEACEKIEEENKRKIKITVGEYDSHFYLEIGNAVSKDINVNGYSIPTTKQNKKEHGIGIGVVKSVIDKYDGRIDVSCENQWFQVEINI